MDNKLNKVDNWEKRMRFENRRQEKKEYIQQAFKNNLAVDIIPIKTIKSDSVTSQLRVAAYCRVSTFEEEQAGSFELQVQHYSELINNNSE